MSDMRHGRPENSEVDHSANPGTPGRARIAEVVAPLQTEQGRKLRKVRAAGFSDTRIGASRTIGGQQGQQLGHRYGEALVTQQARHDEPATVLAEVAGELQRWRSLRD